ncbi:MAG: ABC transporter permease [Hyphomicrobiales bacterium]
MLWESVKLALRTIRRNVLRSVLTLLGIVIGVAAVIALLTIGQGAQDRMTAEMSKLGSNMLIARPGAPTPGPPQANGAQGFTERDVDALRSRLSSVRAMSASSQRNAKAVLGTASLDVQVVGAEPSYFTTQDWVLTLGAGFTESDARSGATLCVIGQTVVQNFFANTSPLGAYLRIGNVPCLVIGTVAAKGQSAFGTDQDNIVVMPLRTFQRRLAGSQRISTIAVSVMEAEALPQVQAAMTEILRETRRIGPGEDDDFSVRDMTQLAAALSTTTSTMTGLLGAVAAVSLLVGGIGIMNIMLVSVAERTREIGIRLAVGALARQVLTQFLVEAVVLCLLGGLLGLLLGLGLAWLGTMLLQVPMTVQPAIALMAVGFLRVDRHCLRLLPARRAAQLDPIEALRHE